VARWRGGAAARRRGGCGAAAWRRGGAAAAAGPGAAGARARAGACGRCATCGCALYLIRLTRPATAQGEAMGAVAQLSNASFVYSVGDNVYESGLTNEADPWFDETFTDIYTHPGLSALPWFTMMGNHEYYGNSSGELAASLTAKDARWHPFRSNVQRFAAADGTPLLTLASIDTSPFLSKYRKEDTDWRGLTPVVLPGDVPVAGEGIDPAPGQQPPAGSLASRLAASARGVLRDFPVPTKAAWAAWEAAQTAQLEAWLVEAQASKWTFVGGHHPLRSWSGKEYGLPGGNLAAISDLLAKYAVPVYMNGHNHNLWSGKIAGGVTNYLCSGAGSLVDPDVVDPGDGSLLWGQNTAGFLAISMDKESVVTTFVDADANVLFERKIDRNPF